MSEGHHEEPTDLHVAVTASLPWGGRAQGGCSQTLPESLRRGQPPAFSLGCPRAGTAVPILGPGRVHLLPVPIQSREHTCQPSTMVEEIPPTHTSPQPRRERLAWCDGSRGEAGSSVTGSGWTSWGSEEGLWGEYSDRAGDRQARPSHRTPLLPPRPRPGWQAPSSSGCTGPASTQRCPITETPSTERPSTPTAPWQPAC